MTVSNVVTEVLNNIRANIADLKACDNNDYILAFDNGLGIRFIEDGHKPVPCSLDKADCIANDRMPEEAWAYIPNVSNGKGEKARVVRRQTAIAKELQVMQSTLDDIESRFAECNCPQCAH